MRGRWRNTLYGPRVKTEDDLVQVARALADTLRSDMTFKTGSTSSNSHWWPDQLSDREKIRARGTAGLEFIRVHAGTKSEWYRRARTTLRGEDTGRAATIESRVHYVGDVLEEWAHHVAEGIVEPLGTAGARAREVASTDLMEQVRALNADKAVAPAAPIVLAGAALEVALRGAVEEAGLTYAGAGSISTYGKVLRSAELISKQDMKDIESMAGIRNAAAHGDHEELSRERAGLMEQQVNLFLAKLGAH